MVIENLVKAALELLKRSSFVSCALATSCFAAAITFLVLSKLDPDNFVILYRNFGVWFWIGTNFLYVLAVFLWFRERYAKTIHFVFDEHRSFAHLAKQPDGRELTQISCHFQVFSRIGYAVRLLQVRLKWPYTRKKTINPFVIVRAQNSNMYGLKHVVPGDAASKDIVSGSEASVMMFYEGDITSRIRKNGLVMEISDHLGNWHKVNIPYLKIH